jgi:hypothetical protein
MKDGSYKIKKGDLEFVEEIKNNQTSDGWWVVELVLMGYEFTSINESEENKKNSDSKDAI